MEHKHPLVSIVTPSYNQGLFIEETILSVKNQDYPNIEHIIVDGGSTDSTLEILKKYKSTYNMHWISEPDEGMYQAINKGLRVARGEIMSYLNSDDLYLPWAVATVVEYFRDSPDVDLFYGDMLGFTIDNQLALRFSPPFNLQYIQRTGFLGQPTVFWQRRVFERFGGFDEGLKFVGDCDYWMKAGRVFSVKKINEFLAIERDHLQAKRFAQHDSLKDELRRVRARYYDLDSIQGRVGRIGDQVWAFFWKRYYMGKFLLLYHRRNLSVSNHSWFNLLNMPNFRLAPLYKLLLGFLPFINHGRPRWVALGTSLLSWSKEDEIRS